MIAYDLDGILVSDLVFENFASIDEFVEQRAKSLCPIFIPTGDWILLTGRPVQDKFSTLLWISTYFCDNLPVKIYHDNPDPRSPWKYKLEILNKDEDIDTFIESDVSLYSFLKVHSNKHVVLFSDLIKKGIDKL